jgi:hypothetical protein
VVSICTWRRSVIVRMTEAGEKLETVRIDNDPVALGLEIAKAGPDPQVVLEATYGWYWAVDVLQAAGAEVHLAHPLGVKGFIHRRVKNDVRDATDLADLLRMHRLPEAYVAPPAVRELRELVRHRAKLVAMRSSLKAQVHAVLAKQGVHIAVSDLFGLGGQELLAKAAWTIASIRVRAASSVSVASDLEPALFETGSTQRTRARYGFGRSSRYSMSPDSAIPTGGISGRAITPPPGLYAAVEPMVDVVGAIHGHPLRELDERRPLKRLSSTPAT